ncbi:hypothetical protein V3C99_018061 [Haemonchus contortus]|uniref:Endo/exonuclease/phosphatase domain-containing protein n=1 Tax=Haemonchus contortus TaxID=6289 RepID=A0A7I4Z414_HAECO
MRGLPRSERPRPKKLVRIGTLNVGLLTGKSREVADLMKCRNIEVLCLQEPAGREQKGKLGEGVKLFRNEKDTRRNGVDITVAESLKDLVSAVNRTSSRIMAVRIDTMERHWRIIFGGDHLTIRGDLNGHLCSERRVLEWAHKGGGVGVRNEEESVSTLETAHDFAVCSTLFAKRESQKIIYGSGGRETEIDHVLVEGSPLETVKDIMVLPGSTAQASPSRHSYRSSQEIKNKNETEDPVMKLHRSEKEHLKKKLLKTGLPEPERPLKQNPRKGNARINSRCCPRGQGSMVLERCSPRSCDAEEIGLQTLAKDTNPSGPSCLQNFQEARRGYYGEGKEHGNGRIA